MELSCCICQNIGVGISNNEVASNYAGEYKAGNSKSHPRFIDVFLLPRVVASRAIKSKSEECFFACNDHGPGAAQASDGLDRAPPPRQMPQHDVRSRAEEGSQERRPSH